MNGNSIPHNPSIKAIQAIRREFFEEADRQHRKHLEAERERLLSELYLVEQRLGAYGGTAEAFMEFDGVKIRME